MFWKLSLISRLLHRSQGIFPTIRAQYDEEGKRENKQKKLLMLNLKEAFSQFKISNPDAKIGFTSFTLLRPREVVLIGASGTHSVCVCLYHENTKQMFDGASLDKLKILENEEITEETLDDRNDEDREALTEILTEAGMEVETDNPINLDNLIDLESDEDDDEEKGEKEKGEKEKKGKIKYKCIKDCVKELQCETPTDLCMFGQCEKCLKKDVLRSNLEELFDQNEIEKVTYKQWTTTDRSTLQVVEESTDIFINKFVEQIVEFQSHDFVTKKQTEAYKSCKANLKQNECLVVLDFAENYSFCVQDEIQSFHWSNESLTLMPLVAYYKNKENELCHVSYVMISESLTHNTGVEFS